MVTGRGDFGDDLLDQAPDDDFARRVAGTSPPPGFHLADPRVLTEPTTSAILVATGRVNSLSRSSGTADPHAA